MTAHDPLTVRCPSCIAPPGHPCGGNEPHADRLEAARHAAATLGTCALCGHPLHRLTDPDDAIHLDPADEAACPPLPDPRHDFDAYQLAIHQGAQPGHPGVEHWQPIGETHDDSVFLDGDPCPRCPVCLGASAHGDHSDQGHTYAGFPSPALLGTDDTHGDIAGGLT